MTRAAALLLLAGCSKIFGLSSPQHAIDAPAADSDATAIDAVDGQVDIADAAPGHCVTQADCPASVCLPSTVCADAGDVAWLSERAVSASTTCTMQAPCIRLTDALATNRPYIRVVGTIANLSSISRDVTIFGEPGGGFSGSLQINAGVVGLYTLDLTGGSTCIQNQGATLTVEHCVVHDCSNLGISSNGALTLDGSTITRCRNGGVVVLDPTFAITNNFITANGSTMTQTGGISIQAASSALASRIDFNTVAANAIKSSTNTAGGIYCNVAGVSCTGNVIVRNTVNGSTGTSYANESGQCDFSRSLAQPTDSLGFVSTAANDYHITAASPLRDIPMLTTTLTTDVDGESRPYGSGYDLGADEYHP
jgi:hypothetical protein